MQTMLVEREAVVQMEKISVETVPCDPATTRVTLLKGGTSGEREISLASGAAAAKALRGEGFPVVEIDTKDADFVEQLIASKPDAVFIALHGRDGEDGTVQGLCELLGLPYTGPGVLASALAMDKLRAKTMYRAAGLPTAPWEVLVKAEHEQGTYDQSFFEGLLEKMGGKCVVKPSREGSALGVHIVEDAAALAEAVAEAFTHDDELVVEKFVAGVEITVGVLGNEHPEVLPIIEIVPQDSSAFYDFDAKYSAGGASHIIPARLDDATTATCRDFAREAHFALGCTGVSRTDMIVSDKDGTPYLLETNTIPGMTATSLLPDAAARAGLEFGPLCRTLVELALKR